MIKININKTLDTINLDIDLHITQGEFIALTGSSGSGKTTFLRILAGLEKASGNIMVENKIWQNKNCILPPQKREIGFVFQDYALFENMSVIDNLLFVNNDINLANELLKITELTKLKNRYPNSLSGGQKQRVSLCRALMKKPKILLLDEPLSALDIDIRKKLQNEILALHKKFNITTIMVSHDPSEIYKMASRVVVLENGKLIKNNTPKKVLLTKSAKFIGEILDIKKTNLNYTAIISIDNQLIEINLSQTKAQKLKIGETIELFTDFGLSKVDN